MHCKCIDEDFAHMDIASDCTNDYPDAKSAEDMPSLASARHHVMRECGPRSSALRMLLEALTHSIRSIKRVKLCTLPVPGHRQLDYMPTKQSFYVAENSLLQQLLHLKIRKNCDQAALLRDAFAISLGMSLSQIVCFGNQADSGIRSKSCSSTTTISKPSTICPRIHFWVLLSELVSTTW